MTNSKGSLSFFDPDLRPIFFVTLIAVLGVSSIAPALPQIIDVFQITKQSVGLIITIFTLPGVLFSTLFGVLIDRIGRKILLIPALIIFALAGFSCVLTHDFQTLLWLRFIQGSAAAALGVINLTLIGDLYQGHDRTTVMGWNASVLSVGTALYPIFGGLLALQGWNRPFLLALLALPVAWVCATHLTKTKINNTEQIHHYVSKVLREMKHMDVLVLNLALFVFFILIYGICLMAFPLYLKSQFRASPFLIGFYLTMMSVGTAICAWKLKYFTVKIGQIKLLILSFALYMIACLWIPMIQNTFILILPCLLIGSANGLSIPTIQTLLSNHAPEEYRGAFMSFASTILRVGQTIGPIIVGFILIKGNLIDPFYAGAVLAGVMLALILFLQARELFLKPHK